jgi:predicted Zn-dependent peptidase
VTTKQTTLPNGLKIITADLADARSLTVNITVGVGSRYEDFDVNGGVSHFLEHLLFKGSKKYPSAQAISEAVDAVGGYNNAYTSEDLTCFYIKVPARHGELALDILCDMMRNPLIEVGELERERDVIIEEMNVYRDDPSRYVMTLIPGLIFPNNPLGRDIIGPEEVIRTVSVETVAKYQKDHYSPNNMTISVAGRVDHELVVAQVTAALGSLEAIEQAPFLAIEDDLSDDLSVGFAKETAQAHFIIASRAYNYDHADDRASKVMSAILGRGMSSRLFMNVRERQGLAYTVYCDINNYVDTGIFHAYAGVNLDKIEQAITSVLHELKLIRDEPVSESELAKAQQQLRAGLEMSLESNSAIADRLGGHLMLLGKAQTVDEVIAEIDKVTIEDVQRVARDMLDLSQLRFAIITPEPDAATRHFESEITTTIK